MAEISLDDMNSLLAKLEWMATKTANQITQNALTKSGQIIADSMEEEAPKRTGDMSKSIKVSGIRTKNGIKYVEVRPDKEHYYYTWVDLGNHHGVTANPFMARALAKNKSNVKNIIISELKKGLGL